MSNLIINIDDTYSWLPPYSEEFEVHRFDPNTPVRAFRFTKSLYRVGQVLMPRKPICVTPSSANLPILALALEGFYVAPANAIPRWLEICDHVKVSVINVYEVRFPYKDLYICHINDELLQGFVRGPITIVGHFKSSRFSLNGRRSLWTGFDLSEEYLDMEEV